MQFLQHRGPRTDRSLFVGGGYATGLEAADCAHECPRVSVPVPANCWCALSCFPLNTYMRLSLSHSQDLRALLMSAQKNTSLPFLSFLLSSLVPLLSFLFPLSCLALPSFQCLPLLSLPTLLLLFPPSSSPWLESRLLHANQAPHHGTISLAPKPELPTWAGLLSIETVESWPVRLR